MNKINVLIIGGGGREHAIAIAVKNSPRCGKLYCAPGNAGISEIADCHPDVKATDLDKIVTFVKKHKDIKLVVVAPDDPLAMGLVDRLEKETAVRVFGPRANAAIIEASKVFSKNLMRQYGIPTAAYSVCNTEYEARIAVMKMKFPVVIKADGLALGKGVVICQNLAEAEAAIDNFLVKRVFGTSGSTVVVEEFLTGFEVSVLAFTDGKTVVPMISSQDHKRAGNGDTGLNTGGMGTYAPNAKYTAAHAAYAYEKIFLPTINAMRREGRTFKGVIYFGLMIDGDSVRVLEYNARFGDPEAQVVLPLLRTDILDIFDAVIDGRLDKINIEWSDKCAVCVIAASGGYPQEYKKGLPITYGEFDKDITVYHAGTALAGRKVVTNGGRVLGVTAVSGTLEEAREKAYRNIRKISFEGMFYRNDIGER